MSNIKVKQQEIDGILENSDIFVQTIFDKVTVVAVRLPNGFVLTESSGAVDKDNYDEELGKEVCLRKIKDRLWAFEGYLLAENVWRSK